MAEFALVKEAFVNVDSVFFRFGLKTSHWTRMTETQGSFRRRLSGFER